MTRWLLKSEVESPLRLDPAGKRLTFTHPTGKYSTILEDKPAVTGAPLLADVYVVFEAADIDAAGAVGREHLREFTETLALITGCRTWVHRVVSLWDWSPAVVTHVGRLYHYDRQQDTPLGEIKLRHIRSVVALSEKERPEPVGRALRWFVDGLNADYPVEQFQWFWLTLEVLAQNKKNIKKLMKRHSGEEAGKLYDVSKSFRNALAHGNDLKVVEQKHGYMIADLVTDLANIARVALLDLLAPTSEARPECDLHLLDMDDVLNYQAVTRATVAFTLDTAREPQLEDIPTFTINVVTREVPAQDVRHGEAGAGQVA
jgi:hypothetical protein